VVLHYGQVSCLVLQGEEGIRGEKFLNAAPSGVQVVPEANASGTLPTKVCWKNGEPIRPIWTRRACWRTGWKMKGTNTSPGCCGRR